MISWPRVQQGLCAAGTAGNCAQPPIRLSAYRYALAVCVLLDLFALFPF